MSSKPSESDQFGRALIDLGDGKPKSKLQLSSDRQMIDSIAGAGCWLRQDPSNQLLLIAESIEESILAVQLGIKADVIGVTGTSMLRTLDVGRSYRLVAILANNDEPGLEAATCLADRLENQGQPAEVVPPSLDYLIDLEVDSNKPRPTKLDWLEALSLVGRSECHAAIFATIERSIKERTL